MMALARWQSIQHVSIVTARIEGVIIYAVRTHVLLSQNCKPRSQQRSGFGIVALPSIVPFL
jgi:hypothetical protein